MFIREWAFIRSNMVFHQLWLNKAYLSAQSGQSFQCLLSLFWMKRVVNGLTVKAPITTATDGFKIISNYFSKKIRHDISHELSAGRQFT